ncbi:MAG TPA: GC-type dockerin domain-anchored protein [Phycisphaerales bacterium]|nr:GC-type dockerin domain-anchored protein [Phycisphaerales bacterium]
MRSTPLPGPLMFTAAIASLLVSLLAPRAGAQCDTFVTPAFTDTAVGPDHEVLAAIAYASPQGAGTPWTVVAGRFTTIGGRSIKGIAAWDGSTWRPLGASRGISEIDGEVHALTTYNGDLIAGGRFTSAGGVTVANVARWNGFTWQPMGALTNTLTDDVPVRTFGGFNTDLYAGGGFTTADGLPLRYLARWNGTGWVSVGGGLLPHDPANLGDDGVWSLQSYGSSLVVGGNIAQFGGVVTPNIARWNGFFWSAMGSGFGGTDAHLFKVRSMCVQNSLLYMGGDGVTGTLGSPFFRCWDGAAWTDLAYTVGAIRSVVPHLGGILIGGTFDEIATQPLPGLAHFTAGGQFVPLATALEPGERVASLSSVGGPIVLGGAFRHAAQSARLAAVNGSSFFPYQEAAPRMNALTTFNGRVYGGGSFIIPGDDATVDIRNIGWWAGGSVMHMGTGTNGPVHAIKGYLSGPIGLQTRNIVAGGVFTRAGTADVSNIAIWSEQGPVPPPEWRAMGAGLSGQVNAVEHFGNSVYAAGEFSFSGATAVQRIARFNGTGWVTVANGLNDHAYAMKVYNGQLYVGGRFTTAGGVQTGGLARWNGSAWSAVGGVFGGTVHTLEVYNNELIIGGSFTGLAGNPNIARYNGVTYATLGSGGAGAPVRSLTVGPGPSPALYVGGDFTTIGGVSANRLARWSTNSGWQPVLSGVPAPVRALATIQTEVHAGLPFEGGTRRDPWVRYSTNGLPWFLSTPDDVTACLGNPSGFLASTPVGYTAPHQWRRGSTPLQAGPTDTGSVIDVADRTRIVFFAVNHADAGAYTLTFSNSCGSVTSPPARLFVSPGDVGITGGIFGHDGVYDNNDFVVFIDLFFASSPLADLGSTGGVSGPDGVWDNNDFVVFIEQFFTGC